MISEISKVGKYFEGMMWINQLKWKVKDIHLRLSCSNTNLPFLRTFWISQETQGVTSCPILLFQNHTRDNRMRSAYFCCFYYWHVQFCTICGWMPTLCIEWFHMWVSTLSYHAIIPEILGYSSLGFWWSHFLEANLFQKPGSASFPCFLSWFLDLLSPEWLCPSRYGVFLLWKKLSKHNSFYNFFLKI